MSWSSQTLVRTDMVSDVELSGDFLGGCYALMCCVGHDLSSRLTASNFEHCKSLMRRYWKIGSVPSCL